MLGSKLTALIIASAALLASASPDALAQTPPPVDEKQAVLAARLYLEGDALRDAGSSEDALVKFHEAANVYEAAGDTRGRCDSLIEIGTIEIKLGRYGEAEATLGEARQLAVSAGDSEREFTTVVVLGNLYVSIGRTDEGIVLLERQIELSKGDIESEILSVQLLSGLYSLKGDTTTALRLREEALARSRSFPELEASGLLGIASTYAQVGQFDDAVEYYTQAREKYRELGESDWERRTVTGLITAYTVLEQFDEALALENQALALAAGDPSAEYAVLSAVADAYRNRGLQGDAAAADLATSLSYYDRADAAAALIPDHSSREGARYKSLAARGNAENHQGQYEKALAHLMEALARSEFGPPFDPSLLRDIGIANEKLGRDDAAMDFYERSIAVGEQFRGASSLEAFRQNIGALYARSYGHAALLRFRQQRQTDAFDLSERARARTFLDLVGTARLETPPDADPALAQRERDVRIELSVVEQELRAERAKSAEILNAERVRELEGRVNERRMEYEEAKNALQLDDAAYYSLVTAETLSLPKVQALLDEQTTLLSYFVTDEVTMVFVITSDSFEAQTLDIGADDIHEIVRAFTRTTGDRGDATPQLTRLHSRLVAPLLPLIKTPVVGIIPHGDLHYVPFAALGDGSSFFGDDYALFHLPSASALPAIRSRLGEIEGNALVMSHDVPGGVEEARTIARQYGVRPWIEGDASEARLRAEVADAGILHIAAHGELTAATPLFSRVALAPEGEYDGAIEVHEVYGLDLRGTGLVVLSACVTHLGTFTGGDDLVGLTRAFIYAGTPSVVASLWNVPDPETRLFMESFYEALQQGRTKAEALQQAQKIVRDSNPSNSSPYYWAGFVLTGDPGPIVIPLGNVSDGSSSRWPFIAVGAAAVLMVSTGGAWMLWRRARRHGTSAAGEGWTL